jgi:sn-glycerol 3-phosphate transport system permease protein
VLSEANYLNSLKVTVIFSVLTALLAMGVALLLATAADRVVRGKTFYRTLLIWPYAIAPAIAAVLWIFLFHPQIGLIGRALNSAGLAWDYKLNGNQAMLVVILASAWKQVSYNFIFFLAGLQSIPKAVLEAAAIDGARATRRFWTIIFPLLSPTTFFLLVVNLVYAFFDTFGVIDALTKGGPAKATETLIYRAYVDGRVNLDLGSSSAQSVVLMIVVILLTAIQFRYVERRVHY